MILRFGGSLFLRSSHMNAIDPINRGSIRGSPETGGLK